MLTELYIEALLVDEKLADQVWDAWYKGEIDDRVAWLALWLMAFRPLCLQYWRFCRQHGDGPASQRKH